MKKIVLSSIVIVLIPTLVFLPIYALMVHTANTGLEDYSDDIPGKWRAFQYYYESERYVCDEEHSMQMQLTGNSI